MHFRPMNLMRARAAAVSGRVRQWAQDDIYLGPPTDRSPGRQGSWLMIPTQQSLTLHQMTKPMALSYTAVYRCPYDAIYDHDIAKICRKYSATVLSLHLNKLAVWGRVFHGQESLSLRPLVSHRTP